MIRSALAVALALVVSAAQAETVRLDPAELGADFNLSASVRAGQAAGEGTRVVFHWQPNGDHYAVTLYPDRVEVARQSGGQTISLGQAKIALAADADTALLVKRRGADVAVIVGGEYAVRCRDEALSGGKWGYAAGTAVAIKSARCQPISPPSFYDDFQRTPGEPSPWTTLRGEWSIAGIQRPNFSANPFCFRGAGEAALAQTGNAFWQDFRFRVAVKPEAGDDFGAACAMQGDRRVLLRFRGQAPDQRVELVAVNGGEEKALASEPGRLKAGEWHEIGLDAAEDRVTAWVDGYRLFERDLGRPAHGKLGLYAGSGAGVFFDDASVQPLAEQGLTAAGKDLDLAQGGQTEGPAAPPTDTMVNDYIMQEWAAQHSFWTPGRTGQPTWHRETFFGDTEIAWTPRGRGVAAATELLLHGDGESADSGYALRVTPDGLLTLKRRGQAAAEARAELPRRGELRLALSIQGATLSARVGEKGVITWTDPDPITRGRPGAWGERRAMPSNELAVSARNLYDYPFRRAPVDWEVRTGEWGVQSRWACTPRWSWFGGRSPFAAVIWHRDRFPKDFTLDFVASMRMDTPYAPLYRHPGNLCATVCADGRNLSSGYTFICGGWGDTRSRLLRGDYVVAETDRFLLPNNVDETPATTLHKHWYRVTAERRGNWIGFYVDRQLALEFTDPEPLTGDRLAIWTYDNPMMLARARIQYEALGARPSPLLPPEPETLKSVPRAHASWRWDFEDGLDGWSNPDGEHGAALALEKGARGGAALRLTDENGGGTFAAMVAGPGIGAATPGSFDVDAIGRLRFDYRIPEGVRANVYFRSGGVTYFLALTGTRGLHENFVSLGEIPDAKADGEWHTADVDLYARFRRVVPYDQNVIVDQVLIADLDAKDYRLAGFKGNRAGAAYWLDNFSLAAVGGGNTTTRGRGDAETRGNGEAAAGSAGKTDDAGPVIGGMSPAEGAKAAPAVISAEVRDAGVGVDPATVAMEVQGRRFDLTSPGLSYDPVSGRVELDLGKAGLALDDGAVRVRVAGAADRLGHRAPVAAWTWVMDRGQDHAGPPAPTISVPGALLCDDGFEKDLDEWSNYGDEQGDTLFRHPEEAASGKYCLRLVNDRLGGTAGCYARRTPFELSRNPVVEFDYRVDEQLRVDLQCEINGLWYDVRFTDNDPTFPVIGKVADVERDGRWHHARVDLLAMARGRLGKTGPLAVTGVRFASGGWPGNREGATWFADDFRIRSAINASRGLEARMESGDASGVAGYSWVLDDRPDTVPPERVNSADGRAALKPADGTWFLHARACDGAGNWGETSHATLLVRNDPDATPPQIAEVSPADGGRSGDGRTGATLKDEGSGVSPADVRLTVAGQTYTLGDACLRYDRATGRLLWDGTGEQLRGRVFADGERVACELRAADLAGNRTAEPLRWSWTADYRLDKTPPAAPYVTYLRSDRFCFDRFDRDPSTWGNWSGGQVLVHRGEAALGDGCIEVMPLMTDWLILLIQEVEFDPARYPVVAFDYRFSPKLAKSRGEFLMGGVSFDGVQDDWPTFQTLYARDDRWRHSEYSPGAQSPRGAGGLFGALRRRGDAYELRRLMLRMPGGHGASDEMLFIDNFSVASDWGRDPAFEWNDPPDASGVRGYRFALDQKPDTMPPAEGPAKLNRAEFKGVAPGTWFFHLRACDGAGNWGSATHYRVEIKERPNGKDER